MTDTTLARDMLQSYEEILAALLKGLSLDAECSRWSSLLVRLEHQMSGNELDLDTQAVGAAVSMSSLALLNGLKELQCRSDEELSSLQRSLDSLVSSQRGITLLAESSHQESSHYGGGRGRKAYGQVGLEWRLVLRGWFLTHLAYPYPTYTEKRNLALRAGIPMSKIDSDLTNWRRRSGWGEICEVYARKSKDRMKMLMLRVQRGEETRPDLLDKVEGIRRYMDKECDKVGDWVHELASFARPEKRPKLDHASPTDTTPHHGGHRSISSVSSSSSLSDISAFATMDSHPSDAHTRDSPPTRSVSGSSTLSDASDIVPSQGPKRSMSFTDDVEQVANKAKTSHTPLRAEPAWVDSPTEYASCDTSGFSGTYVSLDAASNSLSSFTASSESSLPSSESDDGQHTGSDLGVGSATAVSNVLTVADGIMSSECSSIWSTEMELPSLPHMHSGSVSSWRIPTLSEFRPEIGRWVERG